MPLIWRGLDLLNPDATTPEEIAYFNKHEQEAKGFISPSDNFWFVNRVGVAKRRFLLIRQGDSDSNRDYSLPSVLAALHQYAILAYEDGIMYEIRNSRHHGATRGQVLDVLAIAYTHAHARGMNMVAKLAQDYLADWEDSLPRPEFFPSDWSHDPNAFKSGLDFSVPDMSEEEKRLIEGWYLRTLGELPGYVKLLLEYRPNLLKAHRNRYENAIQGGLPKQMMAYLTIYFGVTRGFKDGIREGSLLGKHFGMSKEWIMSAMCRGMTSYGGPDSLSVAHEAAADVLKSIG